MKKVRILWTDGKSTEFNARKIDNNDNTAIFITDNGEQVYVVLKNVRYIVAREQEEEK